MEYEGDMPDNEFDMPDRGAPLMTIRRAFDIAQEKISSIRHLVQCVSLAEANGIQWDIAECDTEGDRGYPVIIWGDDAFSVKMLDAILEDEFYSSR